MEQITEDLIYKFYRGSSQGYTAVYKHLAPSVFYFARKFVRSNDDAEVITADTFVRLHKLHANFSSLTDIKGFLHITVRNACLNHLRDLKWQDEKIRELLYILTNEDELDRFQEEEFRTGLLRGFYEKIEKLPKKCKQVFKLAYLEGLKNEDIARLLKINIQSVENQKARALRVLRLALCGKHALAIILIRLYRLF
jgi:RNA polymerase sigma-70 factor (ECF subfamily)